jgi:hypothetical protein
MNKIYFNNWWPGFFNGQDANNIFFFKKLLDHTNLIPFEITMNKEDANILIEAGKPTDGVINKDWKLKINFIGEPVIADHIKYDIILTGSKTPLNVVDLPLSVMYIHGNNYLNQLRKINHDPIIPNKFCCFIVSNPKCEPRNKMFTRLNQVKYVHSAGRHLNNTGGCLGGGWGSQSHISYIKQFKFMICFENTKMETYSTEKIVNAYLGGAIPIYRASEHITNIFNKESMLLLEDDSDEAFNELIKKIIELDSDDNKYKALKRQPIFTQDNIDYWNEHYTLFKLGDKMNKLINNKSN